MSALKSHRYFVLLLSIFLFLVTVQGQGNSPQIYATLNDNLLVDRDADGQLDSGDTLRYTVEISNCGSAPAENVQFTGQADSNTQFIADSVQVGAPVPAANCSSQVIPAPVPTNTPVTPTTEAPEVENSSPADGATEVALNANITLQFNKRVDVTGDWFEIVCSISGTFNLSSGNVTVTGGPIDFTLDPAIDLQVGETCRVRVFGANVTDRDNNDPPDNMERNYVFTFITETPPTVANTNPTNGATAVNNAADLVITFDEPATVTAASFTLECPAGMLFAGGFAVGGSGTATVTINPTGNLPAGTACQVVVIAANVNDVDANDPPDLLDGNGDNVEGDDYTFGFTTEVDAAPFVQTVTPANGAVAVPSNTTIEFVFSELVNVASAADFNLECGGMPQGYTVTTPAALPASATNFILTPAGNLPDATICTLTVFAAVTDTDLDDPPDNMAANFVSTFTTDAVVKGNTINSAFVYESRAVESITDLPVIQYEENLFISILGETLSFGVETVYAQNADFNIPIGPINVGTIPAGSKVNVTFDVLVKAVIPNGTSHVFLQGTISGSNFASILTDDPETALGIDATLTPLGALQAVRGLPQTGETAWWQAPIVWGLRLALLGVVLVGLMTIRRRFFRSV